jgi:uncharacterized protein YndB with AHSA1/START domain
MVDVTASRTVAARPDAVWPLLDDPARMGEWFAFAERFEVLEGEGVGRRQRMHGHWGRKRSEIDQLVVAHEPPRRLAWRHEAERLDGRPAPRFAASTEFSATLEPSGDGTRVSLRSVQEPASALKGLVIRLFGRREVAQKLEESLDALAAQVGSAERAPAAPEAAGG